MFQGRGLALKIFFLLHGNSFFSALLMNEAAESVPFLRADLLLNLIL